MISRVFVGVTDHERALAFRGRPMASPGIASRLVDPDRPWAGRHAEPGPRPPCGNTPGVACRAAPVGHDGPRSVA